VVPAFLPAPSWLFQNPPVDVSCSGVLRWVGSPLCDFEVPAEAVGGDSFPTAIFAAPCVRCGNPGCGS
jgi:hypothetical protein